MAFLDNSGDIILDAVLTETGRQRMAEGNFKIVKFALGDDEINYALYNLNHASGSGYEDLEILQTPIFEATTQIGLNSSLLSLADTTLLYMSELLLNEKLDTAIKKKNNTIYIAVNSETQTLLASSADGFGSGYSMLAGNRTPAQSITIESCMNNADISMTRGNQNTYITSKNMLDTSLTITFDNNFISYPLVAPSKTKFSTTAAGLADTPPPTLQSLTNVSSADQTGFSVTKGAMARANMFEKSGADVAISTIVQSVGVVGSMTYLNIGVDPALTTTTTQTASTKWTKFGNTGVNITGLGSGTTYTFSTIALSLDLTANNSGATISIPITLVKRDT